MIDSSTKRTLEEYLDSQGYNCPLCLELYSDSNNKRKPTKLSCQAHDICIGCFDEQKDSDSLKKCPECREDLVFRVKEAVPNRDKLEAMNLAAKIWARENSKPVVVREAVVVQKPELVVPEKFESISFCDLVWGFGDKNNNFTKRIERALPKVVEVMGWKDESQLLQNEFNANAAQWVSLYHSKSYDTNVIGRLQPLGNKRYEVHWTGITDHNYVHLYQVFFKNLILLIKKKENPTPVDWNTLSLTSYFNYDKEEIYLKELLKLIYEFQFRYEIAYLHKSWGTQAKVTIYPICKKGHQSNMLIESSNNQYSIGQANSVKELMQEHVNAYLRDYNLSSVFHDLACQFSPMPDEIMNLKVEIIRSFVETPEDFFIYVIEGEAKGFMQFQRMPNNSISVIKCGMKRDSLKYCDHFVQEFLKCAKTRPVYEKDVSANKIIFDKGNLVNSPYLQDAIVKQEKWV